MTSFNKDKSLKRIYATWIALGIFIALGGMLSILSLAGIRILPKAPKWWPIKVHTLPETAQGNVVTAAVSWAAGVVALLTFLLNRDQKERHHLAQVRKSRLLSDVQSLQKTFDSLIKELTSSDQATRLNAIIGLSELAVTPDPRQLVHEPSENFRYISIQVGSHSTETLRAEAAKAKSTSKCELTYPFFLQAGTRLSFASYQWTEMPSTLAVQSALNKMVFWASESDGSQELLIQLCNRIADANRNAYKLFIHAGALCIQAKLPTDRIFERIPFSFEFPSRGGRWNQVVNEFCSRIERQMRYACKSLAPRGAKRITAAEANMLLQAFSSAAVGLLSTQNILEYALTNLTAPYHLGFGSQPGSSKVDVTCELELGLELWDFRTISVSKRGLDLSNIVLVGQTISGANLQCAVLSNALLLGCECISTSFQLSMIDGAIFDYSLLSYSQFDYSKVLNASFVGTVCDGSSFRCGHFSILNFSGSYLTQSCLANGSFHSVDLSGINLSSADLSSSSFYDVDFSDSFIEDANLSSASFWKSAFTFACLSRSNVSGAKFIGVDLSTAILDEVDMSKAITENCQYKNGETT